MNGKDVKTLDEKYFFHVFKRHDIVIDHGEGAYLYDTDGNRYLDFVGGIAVNLFGYNYPKIITKIKEQAEKLIHCSNYFYTAEQSSLAEKLCRLSGLDKVFFGNSGAEANECAIKLARKYGVAKNPHKDKIISCSNSFHGRTLATLTATGQERFHKAIGVLPAGFAYADYGDVADLKRMMDDTVAAVMLEPIQGEGGVVVPPNGYLREVRELCSRYDCLMICDEIQTGIGRTGKMFAYQWEDIVPDIVTVAKALGGGLPVSAVIAKDAVASAFTYGDHGSTFGGNALVTGVALRVLECMEEDGILPNVNKVGQYLFDVLCELQNKFGKFKEIRGRGLMLGIELKADVDGHDVVAKCLRKGLHVNFTGNNVIRLLPPLNITVAEVDVMASVMSSVLEE